MLRGQHRQLAAWLVVLSILVTLFPTPAAAEEFGPDAAGYAKRLGVSVQEADRRLRLQGDAGTLQAVLEAAESETFAGMWIQHDPYRINVAFTRDAEVTLRKHTRGGPLEGDVHPITAPRSLVDLRHDISRLAAGSDRPFDAGVNVGDNRIDLETRSIAELAAWADRNGIPVFALASVRVVASLPKPTADIYGGLMLGNYTCTTGFSVRNGSGTRGVTTAGHCQNSLDYNGSNLPWVAESFGGWYDVQWHTAPGFNVVNQIFHGSGTRSITSRTFWGSQVVGSYICSYGSNGGGSCGWISRKDDIPWCIPNARPVWVRSNTMTAAFGDSGGPVYVNNSAYGTIACGDQTAMIYSAIDWVESGVGVTVLTN